MSLRLPENVKAFSIAQGSDEWRFLRGGAKGAIKGPIPGDWIPYITPFRFTASEIYCLTGKNQYKSRDQYIGEVSGRIPRTFTGNHHTRRGQRLEPLIRDMYIRKHGWMVQEVGFVVPKWCPFIGVSPDGLTDEGCIEIKSPVEVWKDLVTDGAIKPEHYAQMQMAMIICDRPWCDYIVYSEKQDLYFETRVEKNLDYWDQELFPAIQRGIGEIRNFITQDILCEAEDWIERKVL